MHSGVKVTIITPTYNAERDIEACILSVANQTIQSKEHLIIDGESTDATLEIVNKYMDRFSHIKVVSEKDCGIYDAMNKGLDIARGEWIYFLGCDDIIDNCHVVEDILCDKEIDNYDLVYGNVRWGDSGRIYDGKFSLLKLIANNICHQAIFYKNILFKKYGKFDTNFRLVADHIYNMMLFNNDEVKIRYIDKIIAVYGVNGASAAEIDDYYVANRDLVIKKFFPVEYYAFYSELRETRSEIIRKNNLLDAISCDVKRLELQLIEYKDSMWCSILIKIRHLFNKYMIR